MELEDKNNFEQYLRLRCLELAFKAVELNIRIGNNSIIEDAQQLSSYVINNYFDDDDELI
jgi:hypothetical protein